MSLKIRTNLSKNLAPVAVSTWYSHKTPKPEVKILGKEKIMAR